MALMKLVNYSDYITKVFETSSQSYSEWFGYYNYDVLNQDQSKMLCNRARFDGIAPEKGMTIELGYYDIAKGIWHSIGESDSWNWQQGAMMQWLPCEKNNKIIYNCSKNNRLIARIYDIETGDTEDINYPIYGITPDGTKSITLELERSRWCRAYHYKSVDNPAQEGRIIESDGIFEIDIAHNTRRRIISIQDIVNTDCRDYFSEYKHWLEHIMISPSGKRFCFLHRFSPLDNIYQYETRLCIANIDGSNLQVIEGWDKYKWSHFGWRGDDAFIIYTVENNNLANKINSINDKSQAQIHCLKAVLNKSKKLVKKLLPSKLCNILTGRSKYYAYYELNTETKMFELKEKISNRLLAIDGHPSFSNDGRYMITDTYPDPKGYQSLIIFDMCTHKGICIAQLYAHYHKNPASCDLHPKLSKNNDYVCVDTAYDTKHHMIAFKIDWDSIRLTLA